MKTRDSGMPEEDWWASFFDVDAILDALDLHDLDGPVVDVGCGYGTFTLAVARRTAHPVIAVDIEPELVELTARKASQAGLANVVPRQVDVTVDDFGVASSSAALVLLFNLLHCEDPMTLLRSAHQALRPGGRVAVIHWRCDIPTPRGPDRPIRPPPERMRRWLIEAGFQTAVDAVVLPPYHVGLVGRR